MPITAHEAREIAQATIDGTIWGNWAFYVVAFGGSFIASSIGAYLGSYLKKRGENLATKADFQEVLRQLRESTRASEGIRAEIESQYGEAAALRGVVRDRLEVIVAATFDLELWLEQKQSQSIEGKVFDLNESPISRIEALQSIHFPELHAECLRLRAALNAHSQWMLRVTREALQSIAQMRVAGGQLHIPELANQGRYTRPTRDALVTFRARLIEVGRIRGGLLAPPPPG